MSKWRSIAKTVLSIAKVPMTPAEIWTYAQELGLAFPTTGKTPDASIGAQIYVDIKQKGGESDFVKASNNPARFALAGDILAPSEATSVIVTKARKPSQTKKSSIPTKVALVQKAAPVTILPIVAAAEPLPMAKALERDLHPVLAAYVDYEPHFKARVRTIFHEASKQKAKGVNEWLHPDIVGVYFPFEAYEKETLQLQKEMAVNTVKFFSFELKLELDFVNLRESFFQAVSNSSWANEGYLVAGKIADSAELKDELRRLSNAFGIGVIRLNCQNMAGSEILFPAATRPQLDWTTVNRLTKENPNMRLLVEHVTGSVKSGHVVAENKYDAVFGSAALAKHALEKHLV